MLIGNEYKAYLQSAKWTRKRQLALERFQHRCGVCYSDGKLSVHHRTYERSGDESIEDLIPLCEECHEAFHVSDAKTHNKINDAYGVGLEQGHAQADARWKLREAYLMRSRQEIWWLMADMVEAMDDGCEPYLEHELIKALERARAAGSE